MVVGVLRNASNQLLIQQRLPGKPCAGQWEFPGGKLEKGETPEQALVRELKEELGVTVENPIPLTQISHDYAHAKVWLDVFLVNQFDQQVMAVEGQQYAWQGMHEIVRMEILDPVRPILDAIKRL